MLIVILALGTRGDVQPAIALGRGLRERGFRVRLYSGAEFRAWIEGHGLEAAAPAFTGLVTRLVARSARRPFCFGRPDTFGSSPRP